MWGGRSEYEGQARHDQMQRCRDEEREAWRALQAISEQLAERTGHPGAREGLRADYERAFRAWHRARYALDLILASPPGASPAPCLLPHDQLSEID